jgi:hypothetical protein
MKKGSEMSDSEGVVGADNVAEVAQENASVGLISNGRGKKSLEQKQADFVSQVQGRVGLALRNLDAIAALANPTSYAWSKEQQSKIISALNESVEAIDRVFNAAAEQAGGKKGREFKL